MEAWLKTLLDFGENDRSERKKNPKKSSADFHGSPSYQQSVEGEYDVLVNPKGLDNTFWVTKVKKFVGNKARISWYYMPEDTDCGRLSFQGKNEILSSDYTDVVSIDAIVKSCNVYSEEQYERLVKVDADVYFCLSMYDAVKKVFTEDTNFLVYCTCRLPYNPDIPMIQCETCKSWFHPTCLGINTTTELDKIKTFKCNFIGNLE